MKRCSVRPYEGNEEYIFVSYCHKDKAIVFPMIERMVRDGYRVWYDEGIDPGSEWPEIIASHLNGCSACVAFITDNSLNSHNCRREINFALLKKKFFISAILEPVQMSLGMEMQLSATQSIFKYALADEADFFAKLYASKTLDLCLGEPDISVVVSSPEDYLGDDISEDRDPFSDDWFIKGEMTYNGSRSAEASQEAARKAAEEEAARKAAAEEAARKAAEEAARKAADEAEIELLAEKAVKAENEKERIANEVAQLRRTVEAENAKLAGAANRETVCDSCGNVIPPSYKFCPKCGKKAAPAVQPDTPETVSCKNCGAEMLSNYKFCLKCGAKMEAVPKIDVRKLLAEKEAELRAAEEAAYKADQAVSLKEAEMKAYEIKNRAGEELYNENDEHTVADGTARPRRDRYTVKRIKTGETMEINPGVFVLGRSETMADFVILGNRTIGRKHAMIVVKNDGCSIIDNNSLNKTWLNGRELEPSKNYSLADGDIIKLANEEFIFNKIKE